MPDDTSLQRSLLQDEKVPHRHGVGNASLIELVHAIVRGERCADRMLRRLLVGSAQYLLGPFGDDSDLRRHGEKLAARGGKSAKKRAVVAVARKLSVLLHRLWVTGEAYDPLRNAGLPPGERLQGV